MRRTLALILAAAACPAEAARPMQTEDAPVMQTRACELESASADLRSDGQHARRSYAQLGCGIGWHSEVAVQAARPQELALGGKTRLAAMPWWGGEAAFSIAWNLAHHHADARWRRSSTSLLLAATAPLSRDWVVHGNLGHLRDQALHRRSMTWALGAEHNGLGAEGRWQPMFEVFGDDRGQRWAHAGLRLTLVRDQLCVDGSLGSRLGVRGERLATLGAVFAF
ncbi:hypothetical protein [Roseateles sp.]|uniref:hypothetical protein n=1 Tax=Roseateles sp. TaxID=1971397 RepID=UPI003BAAAF72